MYKSTINERNKEKFSKYLSYILRHNPGELSLVLADDGWVNTEKLIIAINNSSNCPWHIELSDLIDIVETDDKKRYSFLGDADSNYIYIRANQGHSVSDVKMSFKKVEPPNKLYHGTSKENAELIIESKCIKPMSRQMVHLSKDVETAIKVGKRHGEETVVFEIDTDKAICGGVEFFISTNGVYLVDIISTDYINIYKEN